MKTPAFWYRPPGLAARLLAPLGILYDRGGRLRAVAATPVRAPVPVICVGNLVAGGAGKTPVALAVAEALIRRGARPHLLTRGHGGRERGPIRVDPAVHDALRVGDEALLLAAAAPCTVARDRPAGATAAAAAGAGVVVMDDGHQNPRIHKDLSLVVVDGAVGFGNGLCVPAGPLREPVARGLARADALVLVGPDRTGVAGRLAGWRAGALPVLAARLVPADGDDLAGRRVLAFAGIGRPEKLFATLAGIGATVVRAVPFPDHHPYRPDEVMRLIEHAAAMDALPVTTAKDAVRLPPGIRGAVRVLTVRLVWDDPGALGRLLDRMPGGMASGGGT